MGAAEDARGAEAPRAAEAPTRRDHRMEQHACTTPPLRFALLFRGESYRSGCAPAGVAVQDAMMQSYREHVMQSLLGCGHHDMQVFLTHDSRGCANATLRRRLGDGFGSAKRSTTVVSHTQPTNLASALEFVSPFANQFDVLIIARYDVRVLKPLRAWPCYERAADKVGVASRCELWTWNKWHCVNDQIWLVPCPRAAHRLRPTWLLLA